MKMILFAAMLFLSITACNGGDQSSQTTPGEGNNPNIPPIINYTVINSYPHDTAFFTEGLEYFGDQLLESSGGDLESSPYPSAAGYANLSTGKVDVKIILDRAKYFGEGITVFNDKLYMLTWQSGIGFIYDVKTFKKLGEFEIPGKEGWGLTHDSASIIMSNGSNSIYYIDPATLKVSNIVGVTDNNGPVSNINELEFVDGFIYANQWQTPYILKIDPASGKVVGRLDFSKTVAEVEAKYPQARELNGIAYNKTRNTLLLAGKKWPLYFEIKLQ